MTDVITSVRGDRGKIETVKHMGHGMLTKAFGLGLDILLGGASLEEHELRLRRDVLVEERTAIDVKLATIETRLSEIDAEPTPQTRTTPHTEAVVTEFMRCSPAIIYDHKTQLFEHLAALHGTLTTEIVRAFYSGLTREPTREDIEALLR